MDIKKIINGVTDFVTDNAKRYITDDNDPVIDATITNIVSAIEEDPRFAIIAPENTAGLFAPSDDDQADQDLNDFAKIIQKAIELAAGTTDPCSDNYKLADTTAYTFLEHLTDAGCDVSIDGRSVIENISEVSEAGLQHVIIHVRVCQEEEAL